MESVLNNGIKSIKGPSIFGFIKRMNEHPVFHLYEIMKEYNNEDLIKCSSLFYLVNSPELARLILNKDQKDFSQEDFVGKRTKTVFGKGLVTSQGELWASQRKILNPVFNIGGVHTFIEDAIVEIDNVIAQWVKFSEKQETFDLVDEMANLAIMVSGKVLFNTNFKDDIPKIKKAVRIPLVCPKCKGSMKHHLAKKMYKIHGFCFDCTINYEASLRKAGLYEQYEKRMMQGNMKAFAKDIEDWAMDLVVGFGEGYVTEQGDVEDWKSNSNINEQLLKGIKEYTDHLRNYLT